MANLGTKLRIDSLRGSSNNIWLTLLLIFFLLGMNFSKLMMPEWLLALLTISIGCFAIVSLFSYGFWTLKLWGTMNSGGRLIKILYFAVLLLVTFLTAYISFRIVASNGGQV